MALVGAGLLLVSASTASASTITCGFGGSQNSGSGCVSGQSTGFFLFGPYQMILGFDSVNGPFDVSVTDVPTSQAALIQAQRLNGFPGNTCVPLDGTNCIDFQITAPPPGPTTWTGFYNVSIFWNFNTNPNFPNGPGNLIRILHNRGDVAGNGFDTDITVIGSYVGEFRNPLRLTMTQESADATTTSSRSWWRRRRPRCRSPARCCCSDPAWRGSLDGREPSPSSYDRYDKVRPVRQVPGTCIPVSLFFFEDPQPRKKLTSASSFVGPDVPVVTVVPVVLQLLAFASS